MSACSESGSDGGAARGRGDLASKTLVLDTKRFYLDVKENPRGRFIKIAEISSDGRKNQIMMSMSTAEKFRQHLEVFLDFYHDLAPLDRDRLCQGELKSEVMLKDDKKYHIDLKENARGRFIKVSETFMHGHSRYQIFIPAEGMEELNSQLKELIEEYDDQSHDESGAGSSSDTRQVRIENKNFYFSCKENNQGRYMIISEVKGGFKNSILIPETGWDEFKDVFVDFTRHCQKNSD